MAATPPLQLNSPQARFAAYACELLASIGPVSARRMFGGYGLYAEGVMVALVAFDRLFLKTDAVSRPAFVAAGCAAFSYEAKGESRVSTSYFEPPADALESADAMRPWAQRAVEAALRQANEKAKGRRSPAIKQQTAKPGVTSGAASKRGAKGAVKSGAAVRTAARKKPA